MLPAWCVCQICVFSLISAALLVYKGGGGIPFNSFIFSGVVFCLVMFQTICGKDHSPSWTESDG